MGFFSAPGPLELLVILAVALIFLGPSRLPDAARSVGKGMREFRESLAGITDGPDEDPYDELEDDYEDEAVEPARTIRTKTTPNPSRKTSPRWPPSRRPRAAPSALRRAARA